MADILRNTPPDARDAAKPWLLPPTDLQAIKAAGVPFAISMLERVIEERARGNPAAVAEEYRGGESAEPTDRFGRWLPGLPEAQRVRTWAIMQANRTRLRPILMTTVMLIAAMIPIALGEGPGAANRAEMAKVIVGGQALSLLLPLPVSPVAYEVAAVLLSKLPVPKAAALQGRLPGDKARRVAFAMSRTTHTEPGTVRRIGHALLAQIESLARPRL